MRFVPYVFCVALVALAATGCRTKTPPATAEIQHQAMPNVSLSNAVWRAGEAQPGMIQDNWLASFQDDQLSALVTEALTNNPDLRAAGANVERAAGYVDMAKAALRPSLGLAGTGGLNLGGGDMSQALMGIMLGASWELDLWGRMRYARNAAQADYASTELDFEFARQSLAAALARGWFTATQTYLQKQIAQEMVKSADDLLNIAKKRSSVGAGNEQDVALAQATLGTFKDTFQQASLAHENSVRALELLLGRYPATELQTRADLPPLPGPIPAGMPLDMLGRRPDLTAAEQRVVAAFHRVGEAKAAVLLPRITLNASGAYLDSSVLQLKQDYSNPSFGAGGRFTAPLYQGGAMIGQVSIRTAEQKAAVADYARLALRAIGDVENALAAARSLSAREEILRQTLADQEKALQLANQAYRVGQQDLRTVLQQQIAVQQARLTLLSVQSEQLSQRVNLHLTLGGSFQERPQETASKK